MNLREAYLGDASLQEADLRQADLRGALALTVEQLSKAKTLHGAKLDPELEKQIRENYPQLLEVPKSDE